jgi:hypothetical protein
MTFMRYRHITRAARVVVIAAAVAVPLALPAIGFGHTLGLDQARKVAAQQAQKIKSDTEAQSSTVTTCVRKTSHKILCKVRSRYSAGLRTCVTDVLVYYSSHASKRPRTTIGRTACS